MDCIWICKNQFRRKHCWIELYDHIWYQILRHSIYHCFGRFFGWVSQDIQYCYRTIYPREIIRCETYRNREGIFWIKPKQFIPSIETSFNKRKSFTLKSFQCCYVDRELIKLTQNNITKFEWLQCRKRKCNFLGLSKSTWHKINIQSSQWKW